MNLFGRTILITRAASQADQLVRLIEEQGGKAIVFPTIEITPPNSWDECDKAISGLYMYDGLMFTSVNGVEYFFHRLTENKITSCDIDKKIIMAVGEKTKRAIEQRNLNVTILPEKFTASELANKLQQEDIKGKCFLFLRGNLAKDTLPEKVKMLGAQVDSVVVYQTNEPIPKDIDFIKKLLSNHEIDIVTFTSPSTVTNFFNLISPTFITERTKIAVIGPSTEKTIEEIGLEVDIQPEQSTIESFVEAISNYFK